MVFFFRRPRVLVGVSHTDTSTSRVKRFLKEKRPRSAGLELREDYRDMPGNSIPQAVKLREVLVALQCRKIVYMDKPELIEEIEAMQLIRRIHEGALTPEKIAQGLEELRRVDGKWLSPEDRDYRTDRQRIAKRALVLHTRFPQKERIQRHLDEVIWDREEYFAHRIRAHDLEMPILGLAHAVKIIDRLRHYTLVNLGDVEIGALVPRLLLEHL